MLVWLLLATGGIALFVWGVGSAALLGWSSPVDAWAVLLVAAVLPLVAALFWGEQYGAGLVAAAVALWILPAAVVGGVGYMVYLGLERIAKAVGLD